MAAWNAGLMLTTLVVVVELAHRIRHQALTAIEAKRRSRAFLASAASGCQSPVGSSNPAAARCPTGTRPL